MSARLLIGDVFARLAEIPDGSVDLVLTSPPFLALRSYLPADHPDKGREIGSEATPAEYLDTLLRVTTEWRRVLAPHGSIAVELGDTYAGSGGAGGDYNDGGLRDGQQRFDGTAARARATGEKPRPDLTRTRAHRPGWPLDKSLTGIPTLYAWSLAYGRNLLTGEESPAGMWRIRTVKPWIRTNPPVGALGDKERPATSYVVVATVERDRWFDLDAVRHAPVLAHERGTVASNGKSDRHTERTATGAPPLDWYHEADSVLDAALREYANGTTNARTAKGVDRRDNTGKAAAPGRGGGWSTLGVEHGDNGTIRGWHLRRALEAAGFLSTTEALDVTAKGYAGAHYAVWPPELCRLLIEEMCPRRVCRTCGQPSRRITVDRSAFARQPELAAHIRERREAAGITSAEVNAWFGYKEIAKNWERTDRHGAAIPSSKDWPLLAERLALDRERFDDLVFGERRWSESLVEYGDGAVRGFEGDRATGRGGHQGLPRADRHLGDHGWTTCGCPGTDGLRLDGFHDGIGWRPGLVLDPFAGSGTTLAVATGHGRDAIGIDLDARNADLARGRLGMFLEVDDPKEIPA